MSTALAILALGVSGAALIFAFFAWRIACQLERKETHRKRRQQVRGTLEEQGVPAIETWLTSEIQISADTQRLARELRRLRDLT